MIVNLRSFIFFLLLFWRIPSINGLKILFYQVSFGHSHLQFSGRLIEALVARGHVVDMVYSMWNPRLNTNGTDKIRRIYRIELENNIYMQETAHLNKPFDPKVDYLRTFQRAQKVFCSDLLSRTELLNELRNENYDFGLSNAYENCGLGLLHAIGVRATATYVATAPSLGYMELHGIATPPSYVTDLTFPVAYTSKLNLYERTRNLVQYLINTYRTYDFATAESELFRKIHPNTPTLHELLMNMQFIFVNSRPLLHNPRVYSDKVKFVGGIHLRMSKAEPLSAEYVELLDRSRPGGVIIYSMGSVVQMLNTPIHVRRAFFHALGQFTNHTVIWKHEQPELDADMAAMFPNIQLKKWIPQRELLKDRRVKLFITHLGLNSFVEVTHSTVGVPIVALPLISDQQFNSGAALVKGLGVMLDKGDITSDGIVQAVGEVLNNPKYAENARQLAEMLNNLPHDPIREFVEHVEFGARFPRWGQLTQLESGWQNFIVSHSIDTVCILLFVFFLAFRILYAAVRFIFPFLLLLFRFARSEKKIKMT